MKTALAIINNRDTIQINFECIPLKDSVGVDNIIEYFEPMSRG